MKELKPKHSYRIDRPLDLTHVLSLLLNNPDDVFVCTDETNRQLENHPDIFPYVVVFRNVDLSMRSGVISADMDFITIGDFVNEDTEKQHLFEFSIQRRNLTNEKARVSKYQIPAKDMFDAHVKLGQTFSDDDSYELTVLSCTQVR